MKVLSRIFLFLMVCGIVCAQTGADVETALTGKWVGTLEYRDYSEPAGSTKRVKLPTWLRIEKAGQGLRFEYIYDDGPAKTVTESVLFQIEGAQVTWGKETFTGEGFAQLKQGRGTLTLRAKGTENDKPVDVSTLVRIGRNILEITRETGPAGEPPVFRHTYVFIRESPPVVR